MKSRDLVSEVGGLIQEKTLKLRLTQSPIFPQRLPQVWSSTIDGNLKFSRVRVSNLKFESNANAQTVKNCADTLECTFHTPF